MEDLSQFFSFVLSIANEAFTLPSAQALIAEHTEIEHKDIQDEDLKAIDAILVPVGNILGQLNSYDWKTLQMRVNRDDLTPEVKALLVHLIQQKQAASVEQELQPLVENQFGSMFIQDTTQPPPSL
jgi:hypothetical protein